MADIPELDELMRQKMDLESRRSRLQMKINDMKRNREPVSKEMGDVIYLQSRINELNAQIAEKTGIPE